jgi:hypothetical protein
MLELNRSRGCYHKETGCSLWKQPEPQHQNNLLLCNLKLFTAQPLIFVLPDRGGFETLPTGRITPPTAGFCRMVSYNFTWALYLTTFLLRYTSALTLQRENKKKSRCTHTHTHTHTQSDWFHPIRSLCPYTCTQYYMVMGTAVTTRPTVGLGRVPQECSRDED